MAATEVEDLAALVGIEIVPDNTCEDIKVACNSEETVQQNQTEVETKSDSKGTTDSESSMKTTAGEGIVGDKLSALEEEFSNRYTSLDTEFMKTLSTPTLPPPCVAPWWSNDRNRDRSRGGRGGRGWDRGHARGRGHHYDNQRDRWDNSRGRGYQGHRYRDDRRDYYRDHSSHGHRDRSPAYRDRY